MNIFGFIFVFLMVFINDFVLHIYIFSGDDCISIVNASSNIKMKRIFCGPGHGIRYHLIFMHSLPPFNSKSVLNFNLVR